LAHKGKATSDVTFNPQDPPEAYNNVRVHSRLSGYTSMAQEVHGPEFDAINEPIDGEVVMRAGGGKKHGRYWFGDSLVDTATTPTLSQIRARSTSSSPAIRPRPDTTQAQIEAAKVISVSSVVPPFLHTFSLNSYPRIKSFRPRWKQPFKHGRRRQRRGGGPSGTTSSKNWTCLREVERLLKRHRESSKTVKEHRQQQVSALSMEILFVTFKIW